MKLNEIIGRNILDTTTETILTDEQYKAITSNWKLVAAFAARFPYCLSYGPYKDYRIVYYKSEHVAINTFAKEVRQLFNEANKWFINGRQHAAGMHEDDAGRTYKVCLFMRSCTYLECEEMFLAKTEDVIV